MALGIDLIVAARGFMQGKAKAASLPKPAARGDCVRAGFQFTNSVAVVLSGTGAALNWSSTLAARWAVSALALT